MAATGFNRFEAAGIVAKWWQQNSNELKTAANRGWKATIEAWLTTAEASQGEKNPPDLADQTAIKLLAGSQLAHRADLVHKDTRLTVEINAAEGEGDEADSEVSDTDKLKKLKAERRKVKKELKTFNDTLLATAYAALQAMYVEKAPSKAISVLYGQMEILIADHFATIEHDVLAWYDNLISKYEVTLSELEIARDAAAKQLSHHLKELDYG